MNSKSPSSGSAFEEGGNLLSKSAAIAITFFATGPSFSATEQHIRSFVSGTYAPELATIAALFWFGLLAVLIYALATLLIAALIKFSSAKGAIRLFNRH